MPRRRNFKSKLFSVIVPAYKQEKTIFNDIKNISEALKISGYKYEIIVVVDGYVDQTYKNAKNFKSSKVKIIGYPKNQGKGYAVRFGMLRAKGDIIGFIDAGMDIHTQGFNMLLSHMEWYDADVIVGSKLHPVSKVNYPVYRTVLSWGYRLLTWTLFGFRLRDTQVGLKFFKKKVVKDVLPRLLVKRYAFDVEMLAVAYSLGYKRIFEAPVKIKFKNNSIISKNVSRTIFFMLWDTMAVFYRLKIIRYYKKNRKKYLKKINMKLALYQ